MDCIICNAINQETDAIQNKVLFESERFVLLPTVGPLVSGHTMIASKNHYESLGGMGLNAIEEFKEIVDFFSKQFPFFSNILVSEHGSNDQQKGGACIVHTHIHLIPGFGDDYDILDNILPVIKSKDLTDLAKINVPYILNMNNNGGFRIYEAYNSYSQIVRKAICVKYNRTDSDWASNVNLDSILKTIGVWGVIPQKKD